MSDFDCDILNSGYVAPPYLSSEFIDSYDKTIDNIHLLYPDRDNSYWNPTIEEKNDLSSISILESHISHSEEKRFLKDKYNVLLVKRDDLMKEEESDGEMDPIISNSDNCIDNTMDMIHQYEWENDVIIDNDSEEEKDYSIRDFITNDNDKCYHWGYIKKESIDNNNNNNNNNNNTNTLLSPRASSVSTTKPSSSSIYIHTPTRSIRGVLPINEKMTMSMTMSMTPHTPRDIENDNNTNNIIDNKEDNIVEEEMNLSPTLQYQDQIYNSCHPLCIDEPTPYYFDLNDPHLIFTSEQPSIPTTSIYANNKYKVTTNTEQINKSRKKDNNLIRATPPMSTQTILARHLKLFPVDIPRNTITYHKPRIDNIHFNLKVYSPTINRSSDSIEHFLKSIHKVEGLSTSTDHITVVEYYEPLPPILMEDAMPASIITWYKPKNNEQYQLPEDEDGTVFQLAKHQKPPFMGTIEPGNSLLSICTPLYNAPMYKHAQNKCDYLLIWNTQDINQGRCYLRHCPAVHLAGKIEPIYPVMKPLKEREKEETSMIWRDWREEYRRYMVQSVLYNVHTSGHSLQVNQFADLFPSYFLDSMNPSEHNLIDAIDDSRGKIRLEEPKEDKTLPRVLLLNDTKCPIPPQSLTPEVCCSMISATVGKFLLDKAGIREILDIDSYILRSSEGLTILKKHLKNRMNYLQKGSANKEISRIAGLSYEHEYELCKKAYENMGYECEVSKYIIERVERTPWELTNNYCKGIIEGSYRLDLLCEKQDYVDILSKYGENFIYFKEHQLRSRKNTLLKDKKLKEEKKEKSKVRHVDASEGTGIDMDIQDDDNANDLRTLSVSLMNKLLRKYSVKETDLKKMTRWDKVKKLREMGMHYPEDAELAKFARSSRETQAEKNERFNEQCNSLFSKELDIIRSTVIVDDDDDENNENSKFKVVDHTKLFYGDNMGVRNKNYQRGNRNKMNDDDDDDDTTSIRSTISLIPELSESQMKPISNSKIDSFERPPSRSVQDVPRGPKGRPLLYRQTKYSCDKSENFSVTVTYNRSPFLIEQLKKKLEEKNGKENPFYVECHPSNQGKERGKKINKRNADDYYMDTPQTRRRDTGSIRLSSLLKDVLDVMMKTSVANDFKVIPFDKADWADAYRLKIKHIIDLNTIRSHIDQGNYTSEDMYNELMLLYNNTLDFNGPKNAFPHNMKLLLSIFKNEIEKRKSEIIPLDNSVKASRMNH
ncbi:hypothetical protein WA158_008055 [Blastocystis sp. Blastoise]